MVENPYGKLLGMMRSEGAVNNPPSLIIGEVVKASPVAIKVADVVIERDNLLVADYLLKDYKRSVEVKLGDASGVTDEVSGGSGEGSFSAHSHNITKVGIKNTTLTMLDTFKVGDKVAVMPINGNQLFIILCRVVRV